MIAGWLAGKVSGIIIFILACLSIPLFIGMTVQAVRIDGLDLGGWYAVKGYKALYAADEANLVTLRSNQAVLSDGLKTCNASVDALSTAGKRMSDAADRLVAAAAPLLNQSQRAAAAVAAIKATGATCPSVSAIIATGFGK